MAKNKSGKNKKYSPGRGRKVTLPQRAVNSIRSYWQEKSPVLKFLLGFAACMILFYIIYLSPLFVENIGKPVLYAEAQISNLLLNLFGQETTAKADVIRGEGFTVSIKNGCDGLETLAIMLSGIIVFPISFRLKWPGILYGTLALMVLNFFRIAGLYIVGKNFSQEVFDFLHAQGGFVIFTVLGICVWIIWANWALNRQGSLPSASTNFSQA